MSYACPARPKRRHRQAATTTHRLDASTGQPPARHRHSCREPSRNALVRSRAVLGSSPDRAELHPSHPNVPGRDAGEIGLGERVPARGRDDRGTGRSAAGGRAGGGCGHAGSGSGSDSGSAVGVMPNPDQAAAPGLRAVGLTCPGDRLELRSRPRPTPTARTLLVLVAAMQVVDNDGREVDDL
jgi:hypothetical protein